MTSRPNSEAAPQVALLVKMMRDDPAKRRYLPSFLRPTKENLC